MPTLWGQYLSKQALLERVGNVSQVGGVRRLRCQEGVENGLEVIELWTGAGLDLEILPSRGLDLGAASFNGQSLCWLSASGFSHPGLIETSPQDGFLRAFGGGLMATCGLSNVGGPNQDQGTDYRQHGRASSSPTFEVSAWGRWQGDDYLMTVRGKTREAVLYGDKFEKTRVIRAKLGEAKIELEDTVENIGSKPAALMILYHFNFGWPLLDSTSKLSAPSSERRWVVGEGQDWQTISAPNADYPVAVIEHQMTPDSDGKVRISLASSGTTLHLSYDTSTLNCFTQWQQFGSGDYVLGLEPGNVGVEGRAHERAKGTLPVLEPGENKSFRLELEVKTN